MQKEPLEGEFRRSDQLCFIGGWEHKMQQEGKKKMKRGQNSYKKSQVDLKQESEAVGLSMRGRGKRDGWIQKESWDHNEGGDSTKGARGGDSEKGIRQKEPWDHNVGDIQKEPRIL
ncbi:hypothetical protein TNCT_738921 [Trichonephila clavata]|uniref:Uncharacterized protein n=1 Tax=Trichonephila clavata TaxID=2740835 RepID=A0A8X6KYM9_TRICU|nr:hypothetical protein TNCT_738921 [Trichonephila clavata]